MSTFDNHNNGSYAYGDANPPSYQSYGGGSSSPTSTLRRRTVVTTTTEPQPQQPPPSFSPSKRMVKKLDFMYTKVDRDYTVQTERGGKLFLVGCVLILVLVVAECLSHINQNRATQEHIKVDTSLGKRMRVNLNITFPALACVDLHVDAMDVAGDSQLNVEDTFVKKQLHLDGSPRSREELQVELNKHQQEQEQKQALMKEKLPDNYCGPCYGAVADGEDCCQTCEDVLDAYKKKRWNPDVLIYSAEQCIREGRDRREPKRMTKGQGCNLSGYMTVNRVAGNFHIAMGEGIERDGRHIHTYVPEDTPNFNASHIIHHLSFGPTHEDPPLNGLTKIVTEESGTTGLFQYFIKVVPTTYTTPSLLTGVPGDDTGEPLETNRYFVTERFRPLMKKFLDEHERDEDDKVGVHTGVTPENHHKIQNSVLPGVFFIYEIYPFQVEISSQSVPLTHLLIRLMATVGGVFTMLSWADKFLYARERKSKMRGKH